MNRTIEELCVQPQIVPGCLLRFHDGTFRVYAARYEQNGPELIFRVRLDTTPEQRLLDTNCPVAPSIVPASVAQIKTLLHQLQFPYQVLAHLTQPCTPNERILLTRPELFGVVVMQDRADRITE